MKLFMVSWGLLFYFVGLVASVIIKAPLDRDYFANSVYFSVSQAAGAYLFRGREFMI